MKQRILGFFLLSSFLLPFSALAAGNATISFSQETLLIEEGQTIDFTINIDPKGEGLDTVRSVFTFDPSVVNVTAMTRIGSFEKNTPGNVIDNQNGKVSWGGFTLSGPVNSSGKAFQVSLIGKQPGKSTISLSPESKLISDGIEKINSTPATIAVTVTEAQLVEEGVSTISVSSETHPVELAWYNSKEAKVSWTELKGTSEISAYYVALDEASNTNPTQYVAASVTERTFTDLADGVHYFHIKGVQKNGKTTKTLHRRVQVDTTKPNPVAITVASEQLLEGESLWMTFATTDEMSGVEQYKVSINTSEFISQESPLEITDLVPGTYFIRVAALDRAGNTSTQGQSIRVYPKGTELDRPDGFNPNAEIEAVTSAVNDEPAPQTISRSSRKLLITFALVIVIAFGIIYLINSKKTKH